MSVLPQVFLSESQLLPVGYAYLFLHKVHANHFFCYGMLYLQTGIHFKEIEMMILIYKEFYRTGPDIVHSLCCCDSLCTHLHAQVVIDEWRRRLLHYLLVTTLHGAFPVIEMYDIAHLVTQYLEFYVMRFLNEFLYIHRIVTES